MFLREEDIDTRIAEEAAHMIATYLKKYGRVNVFQAKEKYGTVRVYCTLGFYNIHSITHPGYMYYRYPKWLTKIDFLIGVRIASLLNKIIIPYHCWLYKKAYKKAIDKFPFYKENIISCADFPELLNDLK